MFIFSLHALLEERGGLVVKASDSEARGRDFDPHSGRCAHVLEYYTIYSPKVLDYWYKYPGSGGSVRSGYFLTKLLKFDF